MPLRRTTVLLATALTVAGLLTACSGSTSPAAAGSASASTPAQPTPSATSATPPAAAPTCAEIRDAAVTGLIDPYYAFGATGAALKDGTYSGDGGLVLAVQEPCTTGDLGGEIGNVTVGTIVNSTTGATGRTWSVMLCSPAKTGVHCVVHFALEDREPIESVSVSGGQLTLVYLTRPDGGDPATVTIRRTAIYATDGTILKEQSRTDAPYTS